MTTPMLRWGLIFLACPIQLEEEQKLDLVRLAAAAYFEDEGEVAFDWPAFKGELRATSSAVSLGAFTGQGFEAEIHLPTGSATVRFLVTEAQLQAAWTGEVAEA